MNLTGTRDFFSHSKTVPYCPGQLVTLPNLPLNFTYTPLALSSATFHSRLKTELFKISYLGSTPRPTPPHVRHHHRLQPWHHVVSPAWPFRILTWHRNETRSLAIGDWVWYSAGDKLVSLTWLLWALRSFRSFTLHYITCYIIWHFCWNNNVFISTLKINN